MAINAQQLLGSLSNPVLAQNEQVMQDYFEKMWDKEIFYRFTGPGSVVQLDKLTYFTTPLRTANINPGRDIIIWNNLVALYAIAGWTLTTGSIPTGQSISFTVTPTP